jgi:hypothetical protein
LNFLILLSSVLKEYESLSSYTISDNTTVFTIIISTIIATKLFNHFEDKGYYFQIKFFLKIAIGVI